MSCPKGKTRNAATGRCRKSCERHQAINPATGRCVSKNYLRRIQRQCQGPSDQLCDVAPYGIGSKKDYRDGLVPDPLCYPRKRNIYTGYCKTPCGSGRAINPATGNCVTLNYLRRLHPNDYDTDDDDDMTAHILFTPTDLSTGLSYQNKVTKTDGFHSDTLTENDLTVMKAVFLHAPLAGVYNPSERKDAACKPPASNRMAFDGSMQSACGLTMPATQPHEQASPELRHNALKKLICENVDLTKNVFVFYTLDQYVLDEWMITVIFDAATTCPVRLLIPTYYGVWRFLVPHVEDKLQQQTLSTSLQLIVDVMAKYDTIGHFNPRMLASEVHEEIKSRDNLHVSFAPSEAKP